MLRSKWVLVGLIALAVLPPAAPSFAGGTYVLGDSIGDGFATTMGFNNLAQIGIHIRGPKALAQIARTPPGSTAYIFLGTNDAEGSLKNIDKSIDDILDAAAQRQLTRDLGRAALRAQGLGQTGQRAGPNIAQPISPRLQAAKASVKYIGTRDAGHLLGKIPRARRRASHRQRLPLYVGDDRRRGRHADHGRRQRAAKTERCRKSRTTPISRRHRSCRGRRRHASTIAWSWKSTFPARRRSRWCGPGVRISVTRERCRGALVL